MPRTERKTHISLTLTKAELQALDDFAASMGPGTYRNEAVMEALRRASGGSPRTSGRPASVPGYFRPNSPQALRQGARVVEVDE